MATDVWISVVGMDFVRYTGSLWPDLAASNRMRPYENHYYDREFPDYYHYPRFLTYSLNEARAMLEREETVYYRALKLLISILTPEQLRDYRERDAFKVVSQHGNEYIITGNDFGVYRGDEAYCMIPFSPGVYLPTPDVMLAQKLFIECDEDGFLAVANVEPRSKWDCGCGTW